jgi:probable F420-dependent oxidoreductase
VKLGVYIFATDETIAPAELARAVEERGFESFFLPEHTHIPAGRETPWPGGGELPRRYYRTLDPFVALAAAATATESLLVGTGVCLVIERDPIVLAKEVATIDHVSDGRFLFGIGAGWNREEMANHGTDPRTRFALLRERILAMKAIWAEERAEFHGEHVDFDPINLWPKPLQRPHPPILVGGKGAGVIERVLDYGDGWFPNPRDGDPALVEEQIVELGRRAAERGRPAVPVSIFGASPRPEDLERYSELGVERCVLSLPTAPREEVLAALDRAAELIPAFGG